MDRYLKDPASGSNNSASAVYANGSAWGIPRRTDAFHTSTDTNLFSSSLPVLRHDKLNFTGSEQSGQSFNDEFPSLKKPNQEDDTKDPLKDIEPVAVGSLLPGNEDELLAGIIDDFDLTGLPTQLEDLDDDFFGSGGGMELDFESQESLNMGMSHLSLTDGVNINGAGGHYVLPNSAATVAGEHPYGEHPSRTLFVRNINSNVEDTELNSLFEQYGDIRTLYTACKHRGFVMISYYDIRAARTALRALQNKPLRRRKLDIHFSIPKDNPSDKDINQGTLVVFNLDASVSNDDLRIIFGAYGEVKEIRETPHKRHHKFIEYYDARAADAALKALNRSDIAGKRIKLEPSRPGGARRNLIQQLSQELDQDESRTFKHHVGSPITNSPPGNWSHIGSPVDNSPLQGFNQLSGLGAFSPAKSNMSGLVSVLTSHVSNSAKLAPIGKDQGRTSYASQDIGNAKSLQGVGYLSHSFPDQKLSASPGPMSSIGKSNSNSIGIGMLSGPQFLWGSPKPYSEHSSSSSAWPSSSIGNPFQLNTQGQKYPFSNHHGSLLGSHHSHHVGSAPSNIPVNRHFGFFPGSPETSFIYPNVIGGMGLSRNNPSFLMNMGARATMGVGVALPGSMTESSSTSSRMISFQRESPVLFGNGSYQGPAMTSPDGLLERSRNRRMDYSLNQMDNKKQYQIDLVKIKNGEDTRTTIMIKNIPNKYTSKMLLVAIDEYHKGTYDFLYLPIDFKNKCNVGYAFINMVSPSHIPSFYEAFNGKKWEKFNSEKVAVLAFARIQGKAALVTHFQNSSLMNEDKRCRPIVFQSEGQEISDEDPLISSNLNICIRQADGSYSGDLLDGSKDYLDESPEQTLL